MRPFRHSLTDNFVKLIAAVDISSFAALVHQKNSSVAAVKRRLYGNYLICGTEAGLGETDDRSYDGSEAGSSDDETDSDDEDVSDDDDDDDDDDDPENAGNRRASEVIDAVDSTTTTKKFHRTSSFSHLL